jgi:hypothetical protein
MQKTPDTPQDFSIQQAMQLAKSPVGQQLIALLQKNGGQDFQTAIAKAAAGDYTQAKQALSALMADPEAQALLNQLGR